jgi:hypothetical protein
MIHSYVKRTGIATLALGCSLLAATDSKAQTACSELFFSEYTEGSTGNNKILEIYNPTNAPVSLSAYSLKLYANGAVAPNNTLVLTGTLAPHDVLVVAHGSADAAVLAFADIATASTPAGVNPNNFNGDDAVALVKTVGTTETMIDLIGNIGCDPGTEWKVGTTTKSTANRNLRRKATVTGGITTDPADSPCDFPTLDSEWEDFVDTDYSNYGTHTATGCGSTPTAPVLAFASVTSSVAENVTGGTLNIPVTITNPSASTATSVTVAVATSAGTATSGTDYTITTGTLTFPAGSSTNQNAVLTITDDILAEGNETINLTLTSASTGATIGTNNTHTVTITDNETTPTISFGTPSAVSVAENVTGGTVTIPVTISAASTTPITVQVALASPAGTATAVSDFVFATQTLTFAPGGALTQNATLTIVNDKLIEANETVLLTLQNAVGGTIGTANNYTVTIVSEDVIPTYTVAQITNNNPVTFLPDSMNVKVKVVGIIYGVNQRTTGVQLTLIDNTGGIGIFTTSAAIVPTVAPVEGDRVRAIGTVGHFNGLTQITLDSIVVLANNQTLKTPMIVNGPLTEAHESELVTIANPVHLVTPSQWTNTGTGFTAQVTDGTNTYDLRIVATSNIFGTPVPTGQFVLTGIGGQFDSSDPRDTGYQITPRRLTDLRNVTGVSEDLSNSVAVYPNPVSGKLFLNLTTFAGKNATISVINGLGQVVANVPANATEINVAAFPAGIYTLRVVTPAGAAAKRFVKIN